ncbi:MAG: hypothetical protein M1818_002131 [Claussenomyces sp. TS43310]|nr:MAG: hypothetical protein M1818_002131 [Claussenomyces sp. TS43310]
MVGTRKWPVEHIVFILDENHKHLNCQQIWTLFVARYPTFRINGKLVTPEGIRYVRSNFKNMEEYVTIDELTCLLNRVQFTYSILRGRFNQVFTNEERYFILEGKHANMKDSDILNAFEVEFPFHVWPTEKDFKKISGIEFVCARYGNNGMGTTATSALGNAPFDPNNTAFVPTSAVGWYLGNQQQHAAVRFQEFAVAPAPPMSMPDILQYPLAQAAGYWHPGPLHPYLQDESQMGEIEMLGSGNHDQYGAVNPLENQDFMHDDSDIGLVESLGEIIGFSAPSQEAVAHSEGAEVRELDYFEWNNTQLFMSGLYDEPPPFSEAMNEMPAASGDGQLDPQLLEWHREPIHLEAPISPGDGEYQGEEPSDNLGGELASTGFDYRPTAP